MSLKDGSVSLGQIIAHEPKAMNSVGCILYDARFSDPTKVDVANPPTNCPFAVLLTTHDLLDSGHWRVVANAPLGLSHDLIPYEKFRTSGFIGAKIYGSAIINEFVNAFYGLVAWDDWADPKYLDGLLLSPGLKPKNLIYKPN